MSGHSKWATIKRKKAVIDQKRGKTFAKLARQIDVAARQGGGDPAANAPLRTIIQKAKAAQMTNDAIDRAIKRATGEAQGANYEAITYEAYAPGGVALLIDILTDNRNRTASEVRSYFTKAGGSLAETGAVSFMFDRVGVIEYDAKVASEDAMMEAAIEAGADDVSSSDEGHEIVTAMDALRDVAKELEAKFGEPKKAALVWRAQNQIAVDDEAGEKIVKLMDSLDDNDDVQHVYSNASFSDTLMAKMG